jgi:hypothetical protein
MAERRTEIMTFTGTLAGIGIAAASLIAAVSKSPLSDPWFILSVVVAAFGAGAFVMAGFSALPSWVRPTLEARRPPPSPESLIDNRWLYTTDGVQVQPLTVAMEVGLPGTGAKLKDDQPPWVRFVATVACSPISADDDPDVHYLCFESLIETALVRSLIESLTAYRGEVMWWRWSATRPGLHEAVLGTYREEIAPVASARLELPTGGSSRYGRDGRCATLILHVEPRAVDGGPAAPQSPDFWDERIQQALWIPAQLARLLADLELRPSGDPTAKVGVRLEATRDIAEMVDMTGLHPMWGSIRGRQATGYFIADRNGKSAEQAAAIMRREILLYALKTSGV